MWRKGCACLTQKWVKVQQCRVCYLHTNATTPLCLQRNIWTPGEKMPDTHHVLAFHCSSLFLPENAIHGVLQSWQIGGRWGPAICTSGCLWLHTQSFNLPLKPSAARWPRYHLKQPQSRLEISPLTPEWLLHSGRLIAFVPNLERLHDIFHCERSFLNKDSEKWWYIKEPRASTFVLLRHWLHLHAWQTWTHCWLVELVLPACSAPRTAPSIDTCTEDVSAEVGRGWWWGRAAPETLLSGTFCRVALWARAGWRFSSRSAIIARLVDAAGCPTPLLPPTPPSQSLNVSCRRAGHGDLNTDRERRCLCERQERLRKECECTL